MRSQLTFRASGDDTLMGRSGLEPASIPRGDDRGPLLRRTLPPCPPRPLRGLSGQHPMEGNPSGHIVGIVGGITMVVADIQFLTVRSSCLAPGVWLRGWDSKPTTYGLTV